MNKVFSTIVTLFAIGIFSIAYAAPESGTLNKPTGTVSGFNESTGKFHPLAINGEGEITTNLTKTAFGSLLVGQLHPQFQGSFEYTVDNTELVDNTVANGGTVTQADAMAVVTSSTTTASSALLQSEHHARYKAGMGGVARFTGLFTPGVAGTEQYIGLMDETGSSAAFMNGYTVGYDGVNFGFHRFQNDVKITVLASDWDDPLDGSGPSGMTIDWTKLNVFEIRYQYLGSGAIELRLESSITGNYTTVHTVQYTNSNIVPSVYNPNFHFSMWVNNKATTDNVIIKSGSYGYYVEGITSFIELQYLDGATGSQEKTTVTTEVAIFTIRNKAIYASKTNFIDLHIIDIGGSIEASAANNLGNLRLVRNATLGGVPAYSDINATNSVVEIDIAGTTVTGGKILEIGPLAGKNDSINIGLSGRHIFLHPGDTLTLAGSSENSATMRGHATWQELF